MDAYSYLSLFFTEHKNHIFITKMYLKQEDPCAHDCPGSQLAYSSCSSSVDQVMCLPTLIYIIDIQLQQSVGLVNRTNLFSHFVIF